jgi:ubiquinone/menaquinone biosynthesis C-methylase UbiE
MVWVVVIVLIMVFIGATVLLVSRQMNIPREPDREGDDNEESIMAYNHVSRWPIFTLERYIILKALAKIRPIGWIVDVGSGPGYLAAQISRKYPDTRIAGLDNNEFTSITAERTWQSNTKENLEFLTGDALRLPVSNSSVDFVISSLSLHHWTNAQAAFHEIHRVLKPGGRFLIFDLRRDAPRYFFFALKFGQTFLAPKAIRNINGAVGSFWAAYTPDEIKTIVSTIPIENLRIEAQVGWMLIFGAKMQ